MIKKKTIDMQGKNFEDQAQQVLQEFSLQPDNAVWEDIALALKKEKKRRGLIWFFFFVGCLLLGSGLFYKKGVTTSPTVTETLDKGSVNENDNYNDKAVATISKPRLTKSKPNTIPKPTDAIVESVETTENIQREKIQLVSLYEKPVIRFSTLGIRENNKLIDKLLDTINSKPVDSTSKKSKVKKWEFSVQGGGGISMIGASTADVSIANNFFRAVPLTAGGAGTGGVAAPTNIVFKNGEFLNIGVLAAKPLSPNLGMVFGVDYTILSQYARYNYESSFTKNTAHFLQAKAGLYLQTTLLGKHQLRFTNMIGYGQFAATSPYRPRQLVWNSSLDIGLNKKQNWLIGPSFNYHVSPAFSDADKTNHLKRIGLNLRWVISKK